MTESELIKEVAGRAELPAGQVRLTLLALADVTRAALASEAPEVSLPHIGRLKLVTRGAHEARNPATGETIAVPEKKKVKFQACKALRDAVN
jgi:nucleoid DNA-binding protein